MRLIIKTLVYVENQYIKLTNVLFTCNGWRTIVSDGDPDDLCSTIKAFYLSKFFKLSFEPDNEYKTLFEIVTMAIAEAHTSFGIGDSCQN